MCIRDRCRASKAYTALHHGEGVWGFGKDAEIERPKALQGDVYKRQPFDLSLPYRSIGLNYDSMKILFLSELGEDYPFDKYWGYACLLYTSPLTFQYP